LATLAEIQARHYSFRVEADLEAGGWVIWFPDLPGCMSQVDTWQEIGPMAREAFEAWTESVHERGLAVPAPSDTSQTVQTWGAGTPGPATASIPSLTAAEAAARLGVSVRRVSALADSRGTGTMFGRYRLFSEDDITAMQPRKVGRPPRQAATQQA
jgi:predicted RNase H-like HicB family nuclease